jgi:hypothetical protein
MERNKPRFIKSGSNCRFRRASPCASHSSLWCFRPCPVLIALRRRRKALTPILEIGRPAQWNASCDMGRLANEAMGKTVKRVCEIVWSAVTTNSLSIQFHALIERCPRDGGEVVAKGFAARGSYLDGTAALADCLSRRGTKRRIFALIFASVFCAPIAAAALAMQLLIDRLVRTPPSWCCEALASAKAAWCSSAVRP